VCLYLSCSKNNKKEKIALEINNHVVTVQEFEKGFKDLYLNEDSKSTREAYLDMLITRKLILLEAQKSGLDKKKEFLETIEKFWEQSLLKVMIDYKTHELSRLTVISEDEVEKEFSAWMKINPMETQSPEDIKIAIRRKLKRIKEKEAIDFWVTSLKNDASITIDNEAIGLN
jgi:hypothetical protein